MAFYGSFDTSRKFLAQAEEILAEEGVELPLQDTPPEAPLVFRSGSLQEAAQILIEASKNIPLDHITSVGGEPAARTTKEIHNGN